MYKQFKQLINKNMSIRTNKIFIIENENGLLCTVPSTAKVYAHVTDNGKGRHEIHGKILSETEQELGWVRLSEIDEQGKTKTASLPSHTLNLLVESEKLVITELLKLNPEVEFTV